MHMLSYTIIRSPFLSAQVLIFSVCVVLKAVERINAAIRAGVPEKTVEELMNPDAQLPEVYPSAADLYQRELVCLQQQSLEVHTARNTLTQREIR